MSERISRREFSKSTLGTVAALGSLSSLMQACATFPTAESIQPVTAMDGVRRAELARDNFARWRDIGHLARLAPTPHNTQPFRLRPLDSGTAEIVALPERFLPEEDH